jgi:4-oxalocrotonate tautomerase
VPIVTVEWLEGRNHAQKEAVAEGITELISREARTDRDGVWVRFVDVEREDWAIGGRLQG